MNRQGVLPQKEVAYRKGLSNYIAEYVYPKWRTKE